MDESSEFFRIKAEESLTGAESEFANGRYNNCANRCYYACFQAAIAALQHTGISPSRGGSQWSHPFVQSEFTGQLINRRKLYSGGLRDVIARNMTLRHVADYAADHVAEVQAYRALRRTRDLVGAVQGRIAGYDR